MLQNIRDNSQGWIAKTIIGIIVALMAFTGIEAIFQASGNNKQDVAKVNGEEITQTELSQIEQVDPLDVVFLDPGDDILGLRSHGLSFLLAMMTGFAGSC